MRQLEPLALSPNETLRAVVIPTTISAYLCVIYTNSQTGQAVMSCPNESFIDIGAAGPEE